MDLLKNKLRFWTLGVGAMTYDAEITRLGAISHDAELCESIQCGVNMEATWHHLGAIDLGSELSAIDLDTEVLTCVFWHLKIPSTVLVKTQIVCSSSDGEDASLRP